MERIKHYVILAVAAAAILCITGLIHDLKFLQQDLIRLHVVAASDSQSDQAVKLQVQDAVLAQLEQPLSKLSSAQDAFSNIHAHLRQLESAGNDVLKEADSAFTCTASL